MTIKTETIRLKVSDGTEMNAFVTRPEKASGPMPALLVFQEAFGVNHHIQDVVKRFAVEGYCAVAPELYHRTAPPGFIADYSDFPSVVPHLKAVTEETISQDATAVYQWLQTQASVNGSKIGVIGYCMGGKSAFVANGILKLSAAVSYYGGGMQDHLGLIKSQSGPLLLVWGGKDAHIGLENPRKIADALKKENKKFTDVVFSEADHGFFCDEKPSYNKEASRLVWPLTLNFLADFLKS